MLANVMSIARIMIIGGPGAGKSWLARRLASRYDLPVYAVDDAVWDRDGVLRKPDEIDERVRNLIGQDKWVIEGGNSRTYLDRVRRADVIIRLVPPIWQRFYRVLHRKNPEFELLRWTLRYDKVFGPKDSQALADGKGSAICIEISTDKDVRRLLRVGIESF